MKKQTTSIRKKKKFHCDMAINVQKVPYRWREYLEQQWWEYREGSIWVRRVFYWKWKQKNGDYTYERTAEISGRNNVERNIEKSIAHMECK